MFKNMAQVKKQKIRNIYTLRTYSDNLMATSDSKVTNVILRSTHTHTHTGVHTWLLLRCYKNFSFFYPLKKLSILCFAFSTWWVFSVIMESLPSHFFSLFFIWSNYRWRGKRCFFPLLFFSPSYLSSSPLCAFSGALTTAFLLGTCLKGSPQHVVSSDHQLWLLFVAMNKPSNQG